MPRPSYKIYLNSVGRKPLKLDKLRTVKRAGDVEIVHVGGGEYRRFVHGRVKEEMEDAA